MTREQRRAQLLELGMQAVTSSSFDEVSVEQVAEAAGISRGLLFHYFPSRRDFLAAIARAGAEELLEVTAPDPGLGPLAQLHAGIGAYVDYIVDRRDAYLSLVRGAAGGDPAMLEVVRGTRQQIVARITVGLGLDPDQVSGHLRTALHGWLGFVEEAAVAWLAEEDPPPRAALVEMCEQLLVTLVATVAGVDLAALTAE